MLSLVLLTPLAFFSPQEASPVEAKARTTVLHLADGRVLRTRARESDGGWEVFAGGEWKLVPAEMITRAKSEHDLLQLAAELEHGLPKDDLVRRVAYADWLVNEGLQVEALQQVDRVLARDPDQKDALALLARAGIPVALPNAPTDAKGIEAFFVAAAHADGAVRELAVMRLAKAPEIPGLRAAVANELVARTPARRSFAALVLRRMFPGSEAKSLVSRAVLDASDEVRLNAALALKAFGDASVIAPAVRAVASKHPEVRSNAIEALGKMDYREAVQPLYEHLVALQSSSGGTPTHGYIFNGTQRAYVQDFDVEVAQGQSIADPIINVLTEGSVLDAAVIETTEYQYQVASERASVRRALAKLTGANPGDTTVAWQRWWQEHGDEWQAGASPQKAPTTPAGQG